MSSCASVSALAATRRCRPLPWPEVFHGRIRRLVTAGLLAVATTVAGAGPVSAAPSDAPSCEPGVFCAWTEAEYRGAVHESDLRTVQLEECINLPDGQQARSFANSINRPVTVYQDAHCSSEADFSTYPARTHAPHAPFLVRAITIWSH